MLFDLLGERTLFFSDAVLNFDFAISRLRAVLAELPIVLVTFLEVDDLGSTFGALEGTPLTRP